MQLTVTWGVVFAVVHFYWAAGGLEEDGAAGVVTTLYFLLGGVLFRSLGRGPTTLRGRGRRRTTGGDVRWSGGARA
jgi:hypothetical protein